MTKHLIDPRGSVRRLASAPFHSDWNVAFDAGSLDRLFNDPWPTTSPLRSTRAAFAPKVNVSETDQELRFSIELPGLEQREFEVLVDSDVLIIKGEKQTESSDEDQCRRVERSTGRFERKFRLGWEVDADKLEASYKNGVLEVLVPKPVEEQSTVRTIPVTAS
ncbi:MAG: Hsp20/alpha crystallin family protein [Myxococcota bacterium]